MTNLRVVHSVGNITYFLFYKIMLTFEFPFKRNWALTWGCQPNRDKKEATEFSLIRPSLFGGLIENSRALMPDVIPQHHQWFCVYSTISIFFLNNLPINELVLVYSNQCFYVVFHCYKMLLSFLFHFLLVLFG